MLSILTQTLHRFKISKDPFDDLFVDDSDAVTKLRQRRRNEFLRKRIQLECGPEAEAILRQFERPRAILFRQVGSPNHELLEFLKRAHKCNLQPLILEYSKDKFVGAGNQYKRSLGKMPVIQNGRREKSIFRYYTIVDFPAMEGRAFDSVLTVNGTSLIDFHHKLLSYSQTAPFLEKNVFDGSEWFEYIKHNGEAVYDYVFSLCISEGILFENYFTTSSEAPFVEKTILPAFNKVFEKYEMKPLIVRLLPKKDETDLYWDSYPKEMESFIKQHTI